MSVSVVVLLASGSGVHGWCYLVVYAWVANGFNLSVFSGCLSLMFVCLKFVFPLSGEANISCTVWGLLGSVLGVTTWTSVLGVTTWTSVLGRQYLGSVLGVSTWVSTWGQYLGSVLGCQYLDVYLGSVLGVSILKDFVVAM